MSRKRPLKAIGIIALITTLGVITSIGFASGSASTGTFNGLKDGGYLNLHFPDDSTAASFTQYATQSSSTPLAGPQSITPDSKCLVSQGTPNLATVTAGGGSVGAETSGQKFIGLGVKGKGSTGTNCGRVEPGESLTITLGTGLKTTNGDPAGSGLVVTAAELDIDGKGNAVVTANLYRAGTVPRVGYALLATSAPSGDSGPDATSGDNFAFPINGGMPACNLDTSGNPLPPAAGQICGSFSPFTSVTLATGALPSGTPSFAIEGGRSADPRSTSSIYPWDKYNLRTSTSDSVFKLQQADAVLNCGDTFHFSSTDSFTHGVNNKDGSPCVAVAYDYNNTIDGSTKSVELLWDTISQPNATFSLTQTWLPEDSTILGDGRPVPSKSTLVEWDSPTPGFITAPACTSPKLPSQYGTLAAALGPSDTTIQIALASGVAARNDAFNLQIGTETISISAGSLSLSGSTATYTGVTRGAGNTTPGSYDPTTPVMTTPFPIIPAAGTTPAFVAKMCLSASSWVPTGITGSNGLPQVQVTETILAEGDMIGKH